VAVVASRVGHGLKTKIKKMQKGLLFISLIGIIFCAICVYHIGINVDTSHCVMSETLITPKEYYNEDVTCWIFNPNVHPDYYPNVGLKYWFLFLLSSKSVYYGPQPLYTKEAVAQRLYNAAEYYAKLRKIESVSEKLQAFGIGIWSLVFIGLILFVLGVLIFTFLLVLPNVLHALILLLPYLWISD